MDYIATVPSVHVALALVVDYIAPAPSGYATPALLVMYIAPASAVNVALSPIVEHIAPAQAVSYAEEIFESSSHVRRRLLASRCGEQRSPVSLLVDTLHSCYKVSITKLTHRQLLCSPRTVGNAPHQGACADLRKKSFFFVLHMRSSLNTSCLLPQITGILRQRLRPMPYLLLQQLWLRSLSCSLSSPAPVVE